VGDCEKWYLGRLEELFRVFSDLYKWAFKALGKLSLRRIAVELGVPIERVSVELPRLLEEADERFMEKAGLLGVNTKEIEDVVKGANEVFVNTLEDGCCLGEAFLRRFSVLEEFERRLVSLSDMDAFLTGKRPLTVERTPRRKHLYVTRQLKPLLLGSA